MNFGLLKLENVYGIRKLELFNNYSIISNATDYVILQGGYVTNFGAYYYLEERKPYDTSYLYYINDTNTTMPKTVSYKDKSIGLRVSASLSDFKGKYNILYDTNISAEIEFGYYPKDIEQKDKSDVLESLYSLGTLNKTGRVYTINTNTSGYTLKKLYEYELGDKRYIRLENNSKMLSVISDGTMPANNYYWIKVEPLIWLLDKKTNICITKDVIIKGISLIDSDISNTKFYETEIYRYLNEVFSNEINQKIEPKEVSSSKKSIDKSLKTPFGFKFEKIDEDKLIRGLIESNVSVFLHGKSSDGKSARVKKLDNTCEIIYLRNATPESLNGRSVYNSETKEMLDIPPTWYKRITERASKEPDRIHILFLDEITNALPSIQGMAFNIVLNKEVNGIWSLPDNVRIIAAGNDIDDSISANELAEPLFNRFAHIYVKTNAKSWLKWALENDEYNPIYYTQTKPTAKIHPAVISYIYSRGDNALRTAYNGIKPNADPRKWELASKVLFKTKNPYMILPLVGDEICKDFIKYCKDLPLTYSDIINGKYDIDQVRAYDLSLKHQLVVSLALCDSQYYQIIRNFVGKLEKEMLTLFDNLWAKNNSDDYSNMYDSLIGDEDVD